MQLSSQSLQAAMHDKDMEVSKSLVKAVMRKLKGMYGGGNDAAKMDAIQALAEVLNDEGHFCKLITGSGKSVRAQAIALAESRYNGIMKRKCNGQRFPPFNPETVDVSKFPDEVWQAAVHHTCLHYSIS